MIHGGGQPVAPSLYRKGPTVAMDLGQLRKKLDEAIATVGSDYPVAYLNGSLDPTTGGATGERSIDAVVLMHPLNVGTENEENHPRCVFLVNLSD